MRSTVSSEPYSGLTEAEIAALASQGTRQWHHAWELGGTTMVVSTDGGVLTCNDCGESFKGAPPEVHAWLSWHRDLVERFVAGGRWVADPAMAEAFPL